jgi:hypothetical protein
MTGCLFDRFPLQHIRAGPTRRALTLQLLEDMGSSCIECISFTAAIPRESGLNACQSVYTPLFKIGGGATKLSFRHMRF